MSLIKTGEQDIDRPGPEGLSDGGTIAVACSSCRSGLMQIWRTRPHEPHVWRVKATCPFCGDESFVVEVAGGFHHSGYALSKVDEPDEDLVVSTVVDNIDIQEDLFLFTVKKASPNAKPIRVRS